MDVYATTRGPGDLADIETCLARNRERERPVSERGVRVAFAEFEPPRDDLLLDAAVGGISRE